MRHRPIALDPADVQVKIRGGFRPADIRHAQETVAHLARLAHEPVLGARVKLGAAPEFGAGQRTAEAVLDVQGRLVRARASAASARGAVQLLGDRLRTRLLESTRDWENRRGRHHGQRPAGQAGGERQVVRLLAAARAVPDEAVVDMEELDYDFLLFTEDATGQDSVVYRTGDGYRLAQLVPQAHLPAPMCASISVSPLPAPRLTVEEAIERLELTGFAFVFFADADTGAGRLVYRRADGDYGLVSTVHDD
ncbi:sigma 54 modulation/S30EA ribosomal C-terminal domain-containing protein [Nonomuraea sp. NPDC049504]|uniref:sigma 54 modulation/S30EA ribosomal C-terminal domain-containing protein n=1 Tax=Nonomuraea sp. NPDC049504 TaxID=3154729 RepID=UPI003441ADC7